MVDIHCHVIPNVDDGSRNIEETFHMLKEAYDAGFTDIITTSHYIEGHYECNKADRKAWIDALNIGLKQKGINVTLYNGAEIFISENMCDYIKQDIIGTLNNTKYVLFELPMNSKPMYLKEIIFDLLSMNLVPVIAHPERYSYVQKDPNMLIEYIEMGALFQSNYASIIGYYGKEAKNTVKQLLEHNMIHFLGTDNHRPKTIYASMSEILNELGEIISGKKIKMLTEINTRKILNNEDITIEKPIEIKKSFMDIFKK